MWQVRSPNSGAADIVKMLLRASPSSSIILAEDHHSVDPEWRMVQRSVDPLGSSENKLKQYTDYVHSIWPEGYNTKCCDLRFVQPWRILGQHMLLGIDSKYHQGNLSVPSSLVTLTQLQLRFRIQLDEIVRVGRNRIRRSGLFDSLFSPTPYSKEGAESRHFRQPKEGPITQLNNNASVTVDATSKQKYKAVKTIFFEAVDALVKKSDETGRDEHADQIPTSMHTFCSQIFELWDTDNSGKVSLRELESGLSMLNLPVNEATVKGLLLAADVDGDGELDHDEFIVLVKKFMYLPEVFCQVALRNRWQRDPAYLAQGMFKFENSESKINLDVTAVAHTAVTSTMNDPTVLESMLPYRVKDVFGMTGDVNREELEEDGSSGRGQTQKLKQRLSKSNRADLNYERLGQRFDTVHDGVGKFQRSLLHFACVNTSAEAAAPVMVRDVLSFFSCGAKVLDHHGRLPLHIACANSCRDALSLVAMLLDVYAEGAQVVDNDGNLPLHVCLANNVGEDALNVVTLLLRAFPDAACIPNGKTRRLAPQFREFPLEMALCNHGPSSPEIVFLLVCECPEILFKRDRIRASIFHRFCWNSLASARDIHVSTYNRIAPEKKKEGSEMIPVKILDSLLFASRMFNPCVILWTDCNGALPLHYASQALGPHSRFVLKRSYDTICMLLVVGINSGIRRCIWY